MVQIDCGQFQIERIERDQVRFIKFISRVFSREIERAEINLLIPVIGFVKQRQALRAADDRARSVDRAPVIDEQRAGNRLIARLALAHCGSLSFQRLLRFSGQRCDCLFDLRGFDGKD